MGVRRPSRLTGSAGRLLPGTSYSLATESRHVDDFGAVGDGTSHLLSESYATLAAAQVSYPYATALTQEKDFCALLTALYGAPGLATVMVHVLLGPKSYQWGETFKPTRPIWLEGVGKCEADHATIITVTAGAGIHGIHVNNPDAGGSLFTSFELTVSSSHRGGSIHDYNAAAGYALLNMSNSTLSDYGYTVTNARAVSGFVLGTFTSTGTQNPYGDPSAQLEISTDSNLFTMGETITGGTSGVTATVSYKSSNYRMLTYDSSSGSFTVGETITGGTSAATGVIIKKSSSSSLRVVPITVTSGLVDQYWNDEDVREVYARTERMSVGIFLQYRCYLEDVKVYGWGHHGLVIVAGADGFGGNANLSRVRRCQFSSNAGSGIAVAGSDANVVTIADCTLVANCGFPYVDRSFLGTVVSGNHASVNRHGGFNSIANTSRSTVDIGPYTESGYGTGCLKPQESRIEGSAIMIGGTHGLTPVSGGSGGGLFIRAADYRSDWLYKVAGDTAQVIAPSGSGIYDKAAMSFELGGNSGSDRGVNVDFRYPWKSLSGGQPFDDVPQLGCRMRIWDREGGPDMQFYMRTAKGIYLEASSGSGFLAEVKTADAGTITSVAVLSRGSSITNGSTLVMSGAGTGTSAVMYPVIRRGAIHEVVVVNGGSGYTRTFPLHRAFSINAERCKIYAAASISSVAELAAGGPNADVDLLLNPQGLGKVRFGSFTATTIAVVTGFIEIKDAAGNVRRLLVG